jgi:hypothetical protein
LRILYCNFHSFPENLVISTADKYKYEWIAAPRNHEGIVLELKAGVSKRIGPIHIALAESRSPSDKMYRLTIGDVNNMITWIGRGKHGEIYPPLLRKLIRGYACADY